MPLVSKRSRYALHGLAYLAAFATEEPLPLEAVLRYLIDYSGKLTLSPGYIVKIFQQISRAGLTEAVPGPRGGYRLARPADKIRLIDIVEALEGPQVTECCLLSIGTCEDQSICTVRDKIQQAELAFHDFFATETVASLAAGMSFRHPPAGREDRSAKEPPARKASRRRLPATRGRSSSGKQG
ncbi:MAG: RrF2 family transcriptional regulator [Rhodospirillales bacterium]